MVRGVYPYLPVAPVHHGHFLGGIFFQQTCATKPSYFSKFYKVMKLLRAATDTVQWDGMVPPLPTHFSGTVQENRRHLLRL